MTRPIERLKRMTSDLHDAIARTEDFEAVVAEINSDPFVAAPSETVENAAQKVLEAKIALSHGLEILARLASKIGPEAAAEIDRPIVATVVDDSVKP